MIGAVVLTLLALTASLVFCWLMTEFGPDDAPDEPHKTHEGAVPSSGGLGILAAILVWAGGAMLIGRGGPLAELFADPSLAPHLGLVLGAAVIGLLDDVFGLGARLKTLALLALAFLATTYGHHAGTIHLPTLSGEAWSFALPAWLAIFGSAVFVFVLVNAVNFLDGANGLAMGALAPILLALAVAFELSGLAGGAGLLIAAVAAIAGFLAWNVAGRLYAGDVGALALGSLAASASLILLARSPEEGGPVLTVWFPASLALPFLVDVLLTLAWRSRRGADLFSGHRDHAYQRLIRAGASHWRVATLWWMLSGLCAIMSLTAALISPVASFWTFWALTALGSLLWACERAVSVPG